MSRLLRFSSSAALPLFRLVGNAAGEEGKPQLSALANGYKHMYPYAD
ncbi:hypothetical protein PI125_g11438 [Phytophthora idaei]|nr:hypothetical protein PI125_g11438 [Phytophthora idaei]